MILKLKRFGSIPKFGTWGELTIRGEVFATVEQPWADNTPFKSCIPDGVYTLEPHESKKYGYTWAMVNKQNRVYHYDDPNARRFACLIHSGNFAHQVQGCIALGREIDYIQGYLGVTNSRASMDKLRNLLSGVERHTIEIEGLNLPNKP